jgi:hypothetical protein
MFGLGLKLSEGGEMQLVSFAYKDTPLKTDRIPIQHQLREDQSAVVF